MNSVLRQVQRDINRLKQDDTSALITVDLVLDFSGFDIADGEQDEYHMKIECTRKQAIALKNKHSNQQFILDYE